MEMSYLQLFKIQITKEKHISDEFIPIERVEPTNHLQIKNEVIKEIYLVYRGHSFKPYHLGLTHS